MGLFSKLFNADNQEVEISISTSHSIPDSRVRFSDDYPTLMEMMKKDNVKPVSDKLPFSTICPYCGVILERPIKRKRLCPECKESIYVRTTQDLYSTSALTVEQLNHTQFYETLKNILSITKADYITQEAALKKKWNMKTINTYDVLWSLFSNHSLYVRNIDKNLNKKEKWRELFRSKRWTDEAAARYQANRGHDPKGYLQASHNNDIQAALLDEYTKGLTVKCYDCCETCKKFDGKTFSLSFLKEHPVLPIASCTRPFKEESKFTFCNCIYQPYYEWDN